jgi:hypothetical protein
VTITKSLLLKIEPEYQDKLMLFVRVITFTVDFHFLLVAIMIQPFMKNAKQSI